MLPQLAAAATGGRLAPVSIQQTPGATAVTVLPPFWRETAALCYGFISAPEHQALLRGVPEGLGSSKPTIRTILRQQSACVEVPACQQLGLCRFRPRQPKLTDCMHQLCSKCRSPATCLDVGHH